MIRTFKKTCSFVLALVIMLSACVSTIYAVTPKSVGSQTIKVGFFEMQGFQYYDKAGNPAGYNVEYLEMISNFTGWSYEYVPAKSYSEALEMLENKEIDLLAPVMATAKWMELYEYSAFSMGTGYYALVCDAGNDKYSYEDWDSLKGISVAVPEGYPITESFIAYVENNNLDVELINYPTSDEAVMAMRTGEAECSLISLIAVDDNYTVLSKYCSSLMYYITWNGNTEMMDELNTAMEQVENLYSSEIDRFENQYFPNYAKQFFSKEEKMFIENTDVIRVAYTANNIPISYTDDKGKYNGITLAVLEKISEITELEFEYVEIPDTDIDDDFFTKNDIDLIADVEGNDVNKDLKYYFLSVPYFQSEKIFIAENEMEFDDNKEYTVAIHSGSKTIEDAILGYYPNVNVKKYTTMESCFDALEKGNADFVLGNEYNVEYYMNKPKYADYVVIPTEGISDELCFATFMSENGKTAEECRLLIHIIDKAIAQILVDDINDIVVTEKVEANYEYNFGDIIYKYRHIIIIGGTFLLFVISVGVYIIINNHKHIKEHKEAANNSLVQKKRYQLVVDNSEDMVYEIGISSDSGISSDRIRDIFGWEVPKYLEKFNFDELLKALRIHPDDIDQLYGQYVNKIMVDGIEKAIVQINSEYDGYVWCEISMVPLRDENDAIISYVGKITNIDDEVKAKQKQGRELSESKLRNENLEELLVNAFVDNVTDIIQLNLENGECSFYVIENGDFIEKPFEDSWDEYFNMILSTMISEDSNRLVGIANIARLSRMEVGDGDVYHYKSKYDAKNRAVGDKYIPYTFKIRVAMVNGQKVAIITIMDNSDVMKVEQEYLAQKEMYANKLFESQKFLFSAISGTYITTLKIDLTDGSLRGFFGTEEGIVDEFGLQTDWQKYCDEELFPYLDEEYIEEFKKNATVEALAELEVGSLVTASFKAQLDRERLDPSEEYNFFVLTFRILMENDKKIASVIFQCDSDNVKAEIEKYKKKENVFRKKRIMALLDNTTDIIFELDLENNECIITGEKDNIYGWNLDMKITDITLEKLLDVWGVYPEDRFIIGDATQKIIEKHITLAREVRVQRSDGMYVWVRISAVPVLGAEGQITNIVCKLVNINEKIREKSNYLQNEGRDKLTGLLTQNALKEATELYLRENSAKNDALILIDMDQLKTVNEILDHRAGDRVLVETAKKLQIIFSNYDYIGKFESDTFCVFVKNIPINTLESKLEWALEKLRDSYTFRGKIVNVSASIGAAYSMTEKATYKELYELADATVYEAKIEGKGQFIVKRFF